MLSHPAFFSLLLVAGAQLAAPDWSPSKFQDEVRAVLQVEQVAGQSLGEYLKTMEFGGCLEAVEPELTVALDKAATVIHRERTRSSRKKVQKQLSSISRGLSDDGFALASTWLRSPEQARATYFCRDALPATWRDYEPKRYVIEAVLSFDLAVAEREPVLCATDDTDRQQAALELIELRRALLNRFTATYGDGEEPDRQRLEERLGLMWEVMVEPLHPGIAGGDRLAQQQPAPSNGVSVFYVPDLLDVAKRNEVVGAWKAETEAIERQISALRERHTLALAALAGQPGPDLDAEAASAAVLDREFTKTLVELARLEDRVRAFDADDPIVEELVQGKHTEQRLEAIWELEVDVDSLRGGLRAALDGAVDRGAATPTALLPYDQPTAQRSLRRGTLSLAGESDDAVGPGNWLVGLPLSADATNLGAAQSLRALLGSGWQERTFEGPLPTPRDVWSDALVQRVQATSTALDETDARLLLELAAGAFDELPDPTSVEFAFRYTMLRGGGLMLSGLEAGLSDRLAAGDGSSLTVPVKLYFGASSAEP